MLNPGRSESALVGYEEIIKYVFFSLVSFIAFDIMSTLRRTRDSVESLNIKVASLIERIALHEKIMDDHSDRLKHIEKEK